MIFLECTDQMFLEIGCNDSDFHEEQVMEGQSLDTWLVDVLRVHDRSAILFVNTMTCYTLVVAGIKRTDYLRLSDLFRNAFKSSLQEEGYDWKSIDTIMLSADNMEIAKCKNRKFIEDMKDISSQYLVFLRESWNDQSLREMQYTINNTPQKALGNRTPMSLIQEVWPVEAECKTLPANEQCKLIHYDPDVAVLFYSIKDFYETVLESDGRIQQSWFEGWLQKMYLSGRQFKELQMSSDDICGYIIYFDTSEVPAPDEMAWWEYSVMLEWMNDNYLPDTGLYTLTYDNARRILHAIRSFLEHLVSLHVIMRTGEIDIACNRICSGGRLSLVKDIPYKEDSLWKATILPENELVSFPMRDYWFILLYKEHNNDWESVRHILKAAHFHTKKLMQLDELLEKMNTIQTQCPLDLLDSEPEKFEIDAAYRWLRGEVQLVR